MVEPKQVTADDVIKELNRLDAADDQVADPDPEPKSDPKPEPKPEPKPVLPAATGDVALDAAWGIAERSVKRACPDLDDEDRQTLRAAAGNDPGKYMDLAERFQAKLAPKKPAKSDAERLADEIFDGGAPGGDPNVTRTPQKSPAEAVTEAVKTGNARGITKGLAEVATKEKLFERGVRIVE